MTLSADGNDMFDPRLLRGRRPADQVRHGAWRWHRRGGAPSGDIDAGCAIAGLQAVGAATE